MNAMRECIFKKNIYMNVSIEQYIQNAHLIVLLKSGSFSDQMNFILLEFTYSNSFIFFCFFEAQMSGEFLFPKFGIQTY